MIIRLAHFRYTFTALELAARPRRTDGLRGDRVRSCSADPSPARNPFSCAMHARMDGIGRGLIDEHGAAAADAERAPRIGRAWMDDCPGGRGRARLNPTFVRANLPESVRTPARGRRRTLPVRRSVFAPPSRADAPRERPDFHRRASRDGIGGVMLDASRARAARVRAGVLCAELRTLPPRRLQAKTRSRRRR
jgi:hypothetical protein